MISSNKIMANAIRILSIDAVQDANSGHPGMPMGMADVAQVLWHEFLKHNPKNPKWPNRDRFVLSNGHGSMLLYSLLHLTGYAISIEDIKQFRKLHSITPGHPEYGHTPGVEATSGPLGQGLGAAVGMALAECLLANEFNQNDYKIIDHFTYCFVGDGCLMEGISHEVASFAGTLGLGKLIVFWDDNGVSIDGAVHNWFSEDTALRFTSYGWHVINPVDGHDPNSIRKAIISAQKEITRPSLICCQTKIGYGSPNFVGNSKCHGAPLGTEEVGLVRQKLNWPESDAFIIPEDIYRAWDATIQGKQHEESWLKLFNQYAEQFPLLAQELQRRLHQLLPNNWHQQVENLLHVIQQQQTNVATRTASLQVLNNIATFLPELIGGSADLSSSNLTKHQHAQTIQPFILTGNYIDYGVREFGMSAIMNGLALYGGFIPYGGTFLTFADYAKNAVRMSALMQIRVIYVYTHDSIGLGEDGPTHQPVEHLAMLRITPNLSLWRPCDSAETLIAWQYAIEKTNGPTCIVLSRQTLTAQVRDQKTLSQIKKGGYILFEPFCDNYGKSELEAIIIATGSEVELAMAAAKELTELGYVIRVVSMPSVDIFLSQDKQYQESILPNKIRARVAVEAGSSAIWYQFVGLDGKVIGLDRFGESAKYEDIFKLVNITVSAIINAVKQCLLIKN